VERLGQHVGGAGAQGLDGVGHRAVRGQRHDHHGRAAGARRAHNAAAVSVGQLQVRDAQVEALLGQALGGLGGRRRVHRLVTLRPDEPQETRVDRRVVVDEEDLLRHSPSFIGRGSYPLSTRRVANSATAFRKTAQNRPGPRPARPFGCSRHGAGKRPWYKCLHGRAWRGRRESGSRVWRRFTDAERPPRWPA
jgi:hypothetical protein